MEHIHDTHIQEHAHSHEDDHVHSHPHTHDSDNLKEIKALLSYMIHHNGHHAEELADLLDSLPQNAQKKLVIAIGSFEAANVELQAVLDCLES